MQCKKMEMVIFISKQKVFESDSKKKNVVKDYILLKVLNTWV